MGVDPHSTAASGSAISTSVIVVSDRCFRGEETDVSGREACRELQARGYSARRVTVPDELDAISRAIREEISAGSRLVITCGGTGISPRDHTPEATRPLIATELPVLAQALASAALQQTPLAALSRGLVGLTEAAPRALIANIAGSVNAVNTALEVLCPLLPHLFSQLQQNDTPVGGYVDHHL